MAEQSEQWRDVPAGVACWHIHHEILMEYTTEPLEVRAAFIQQYKAVSEDPSKIALRLRLLAPVRGELPIAVARTGDAYVKKWKAYLDADQASRSLLPSALKEGRERAIEARDSAWADFCSASEAFDKACCEHHAEIEALHAIECPDCSWNGKTIFPEKSDD